MTPAIVATIITVLLTILVGLLTRYGLRGGGEDVGLQLFHEDHTEDTGPCPGPLVWFDVADGGALLECHTCGYVLSTGNVNDERHSATPLMREGMAS